MARVTTTASRPKEPRLVREQAVTDTSPGVLRGLIEDAAKEYVNVYGPQPTGMAAAQRALRGPAWLAFEKLQRRFKEQVRVDVKVQP